MEGWWDAMMRWCDDAMSMRWWHDDCVTMLRWYNLGTKDVASYENTIIVIMMGLVLIRILQAARPYKSVENIRRYLLWLCVSCLWSLTSLRRLTLSSLHLDRHLNTYIDVIISGGIILIRPDRRWFEIFAYRWKVGPVEGLNGHRFVHVLTISKHKPCQVGHAEKFKPPNKICQVICIMKEVILLRKYLVVFLSMCAKFSLCNPI